MIKNLSHRLVFSYIIKFKIRLYLILVIYAILNQQFQRSSRVMFLQRIPCISS
jgi:hypothetical protein